RANWGFEEAAVLAVEGSHGAGTVDAHKPICFGARTGSCLERLECVVVAKLVEGFTDGLLGHGAQPQALHRFLHAGILHDVAENELAFTSSVTCVDDGVNILALE